MKKHIWVVGSPRSGTSFVCKWIGRSCDYCYCEDGFQPESYDTWEFPKRAGAIVHKWCHTYAVFNRILNDYPHSLFVHVYREPLSVLRSMVYPRFDARPRRDFLEWGSDVESRLKIAEEWRRTHVEGSRAINRVRPEQYIEISYEQIPAERQRLQEFLGLELPKPDFKNRNQ